MNTALWAIVCNQTPHVDDRDKVWIKLAANGSPVGVFVWKNGKWEEAKP